MPPSPRTPQIIHKVIIDRARPTMPPGTPAALAQLAQDCWQHSPDARPRFEQVVVRLEALLAALLLAAPADACPPAPRQAQPAAPADLVTDF
jgi:hypothetical protein